MDIDARAPVAVREEAVIRADVRTVWETLTELDRWPEWNPDVRQVGVEGPVAPGTVFRWKAGPGTITSRIEEVVPLSRLVWTGRTLGIRAVHTWELQAAAEGTLLRTAESWAGWPARLMRGALHRTLLDSTRKGLSALRTEAERRASGGERQGRR